MIQSSRHRRLVCCSTILSIVASTGRVPRTAQSLLPRQQSHRHRHHRRPTIASSSFSSSSRRRMSDIGNPPPAESSNSNSNSNTASRMLQSPLHSPGSGKIVPSASTASFLATTALVPVWAATVLPLSVIYQLGRAAALRILALAGWSPDGGTPHQPLDSGYSVADSVPVPRPDRKYDLVVLGATGFTGRLAARHLAKTYYDNNSNHNRLSGNDGVVKWAIAGRSASKLDAVKRALALELGLADADAFCRTVDSLVVDTSDPASVGAMVRQTRVVATTVGPYTLYGNSVVECCAKLGTHYVDITGEVDWVKAMLCQWQATAQESGAKIISFCGHDSIPWDLSAMELQSRLHEQGDCMTSVAFWDEFRGGAPGGTFATVINAVRGKSITAPRGEFDPFLRLSDGSESEYKCQVDLSAFPAPSKDPWSQDQQQRQQLSKIEPIVPRPWTAPFVMAMVNGQVVRWSYALRGQGSKSLVYTESALHPNFQTAFVNYVGLAMFGSLLFNPLTCYLVEKYMIPKPGDGPSMDAMERKHFLCIKGEAVGEKGIRAQSMFYLDKDAGCLETSRMLIEAGLCLALQEEELPNQGGGFTSPAAGLGTVLLQRLVQTGTYFESMAMAGMPMQSKL